MKKNLILLATFIFLLFNFVSSDFAQGAFNIISGSKIDLCPCSNQAYSIIVQNTGISKSTYVVSKTGNASEWVRIVPLNFDVDVGKSAKIFAYVNSPCNIKGEYQLNLIIHSDRIKKSLGQRLNFMDCYDYSLTLGKSSEFKEKIGSLQFTINENGYEICEGTKNVIPVLIENKENFENSYSINLQSEDWANLNVKDVKLKGKQKGLFLINVNPEIGSTGQYNFNLEVLSAIGKLRKSLDIDFDIEKCHDISLKVKEEEESLCGGEFKRYEVELKNIGKNAELLNLSVEGSDFAHFDNISDVKLNQREKKILELIVNPYEESSGTFHIQINAFNDFVSEKDEINFNILRKNECYLAGFSTEDKINNKFSHDVYPFYVYNHGIRKSTYKVTLQGPDWVSIRENEFELNPKQKANINLDVNPNEDVSEGDYDVVINAETNNVTFTKSLKVKVKKENAFVKGLKSSIRIYKAYIYLALGMLFLTGLLWIPIKKRIKKWKESYKIAKEKKEKTKAILEERRKKKEEKLKVAELKTKAEKKAKVKVKERVADNFVKLSILFLVIVSMIILFLTFGRNVFNYVKNFVILYLYYFIIGFAILIIIILLMRFYKPIIDFLLEEDKKE